MKRGSIFFSVLIAVACASVKQGIEGQLSWVSGNQMPGPDKKPTALVGVEREVYIYPAITLSDVQSEGGFIGKVNKPLVRKVKSDDKGRFTVSLKPGTYSILIKESQGLFANRFDGQNQINPVIVKPGARTSVIIVIDYEAAY